MAQQQGDQSPLTISWANPIGTRDGTLTKDAKMVNCFVEPSQNGSAVVKRPGSFYLTTQQVIPHGTAQGIVGNTNAGPWAIVNDNLYALNGLGSIAIPSITIAGQPYSQAQNFPDTNTLYLKSNVGLWKWIVGGTITKVTTGTYPPLTVFGIAELDGVLYVMDNNGKIFGSAINDGTTWLALDFVQADGSFGQGAAIHKHLQYVCAFYTQGLVLYYDANAAPNGTGIALGQVSSAIWSTGSSPVIDSLQELSDTTYWVAQTIEFRRSVQTLQGLQLVQISTPYIEKILNLSTLIGAFSVAISPVGHQFYVVCLPDLNISLAYDASSQQWAVWTSTVASIQQYYAMRFAFNNGVQQLAQDITTGLPVVIDSNTFVDVTGNIQVTCVTPNHDWGTMNWKRFGYMNQFADTVNSTVSVSFSDNDYQTFSVPRTIDLSTVRKQLRNCGSSRRRAWMIQHTGNTPLKLYDMIATSTGLAR